MTKQPISYTCFDGLDQGSRKNTVSYVVSHF